MVNMTRVWVHIEGPYGWESPGTVIDLPGMPRTGETVYLSEETIIRLITWGAFMPIVDINDLPPDVRDNLTVVNICYVEGEELPHLMLSTP